MQPERPILFLDASWSYLEVLLHPLYTYYNSTITHICVDLSGVYTPSSMG